MINKKDYLMIGICFVFVLMGSLSGMTLASAEMTTGSNSMEAVAIENSVDGDFSLSPECEKISKKMDKLSVENEAAYEKIYNKYEKDNVFYSEEMQKEINELEDKSGITQLMEKMNDCIMESFEKSVFNISGDSMGSVDVEEVVVNNEKNNFEEVEDIEQTVEKKSQEWIGIVLIIVAISIGVAMFFFFNRQRESKFRL